MMSAEPRNTTHTKRKRASSSDHSKEWPKQYRKMTWTKMMASMAPNDPTLTQYKRVRTHLKRLSMAVSCEKGPSLRPGLGGRGY